MTEHVKPGDEEGLTAFFATCEEGDQKDLPHKYAEHIRTSWK